MTNPPYYEEKDIKIYCGDCLTIMRDMPDKSVDLVLTDPPYGIEYHSGYYKYGNPHKSIEGDSEYPVFLLSKFKQIAQKAIFMFCRWDNLLQGVEKPTSFIAWIKNNWTAGDLQHAYGRQWEGILFYPLEKHQFKNRLPDVIDFRRIPPTKLFHPTEKPIGLIKELIENNSELNDIILDPFLGSGTTAVACKELGRRCIGIEINEKYCEIAKRRLAQEVLAL